MILLMNGSFTNQIHEIEYRMIVSRSWDGREWENVVIGVEIQLGKI